MAEKSKWEDAMGSMMDSSRYSFDAPAPQGFDVPVRASVEGTGFGRPTYKAGFEAGPVDVDARYYRPDSRATPSWGITARYKRSF